MSQKINRLWPGEIEHLLEAARIVESGHPKETIIDQPYYKRLANDLRRMHGLLMTEPTTEELRDMLRKRGYKVILTDPTTTRPINATVERDEDTFNPDSPGPLV